MRGRYVVTGASHQGITPFARPVRRLPREREVHYATSCCVEQFLTSLCSSYGLKTLLDADGRRDETKDTGRVDLPERVESATEAVVIEMLRSDALPKEKLGVPLLETVCDLVERATLLTEQVDHEGGDALSGREDTAFPIPGGLGVDDLGKADVPAESGDERSGPDGKSDDRLQVGRLRVLGRGRCPTNLAGPNDRHRILSGCEGFPLLAEEGRIPEYSERNERCPVPHKRG